MASTREFLEESASLVDESMGVRRVDAVSRLSPVASAKDFGRTPLRQFGRLELARIVPDPNQPRKTFDSEEIQRLAVSIRKAGQLQPIRVRWNDDIRKWVIVTGERRYRAAAVAGLEKIDCYFIENAVAASELLEEQLVENLLRRDLAPLEEARGYATLMELNRWNGKQAASALNVSESKVSRLLALLDLPQDVQARIESGELSRAAAYEVAKLSSVSTQRAVVGKVSAKRMTHQQATKAVRQRKGRTTRSRCLTQSFLAESGIKITVAASRGATYHDLRQALQEALEEVQTRINNNVQLF